MPPASATSVKVLDNALREGFIVRIAQLPSEHDPHSLLFSDGGIDIFKSALKEATCGLTTWLAFLENESAEALAKWVSSFLGSFSDRLVRFYWAKKVSVFFGVTTRDILDAYEAHENGAQLSDFSEPKGQMLQ